MEKKEIEEQRKNLLTNLGELVNTANKIDEKMQTIPHSRGMAHKSLKPKSGMYIVHSENGFNAEYQHDDGKWYEINISRRKK